MYFKIFYRLFFFFAFNKYLKELIVWTAKLFGAEDCEAPIRCVAGNFLVQAVTTKSKTVKKKKMTKDLMMLTFPALMEEEGNFKEKNKNFQTVIRTPDLEL